jgi:hypothetical protein
MARVTETVLPCNLLEAFAYPRFGLSLRRIESLKDTGRSPRQPSQVYIIIEHSALGARIAMGMAPSVLERIRSRPDQSSNNPICNAYIPVVVG